MEFLKTTPPSYTNALKNHLKKREKLITLFYKTGRPIFNTSHDNKHIFYKNGQYPQRGYLL